MNPASRLRRWWLGAEFARMEDAAEWLAARYFEDEKAVRVLRSEFELHRAFLRDTGQLQAYNDYRARVSQQMAQTARIPQTESPSVPNRARAGGPDRRPTPWAYVGPPVWPAAPARRGTHFSEYQPEGAGL